MSMLGTKQPKYKDGRTKQTFLGETDINKLIQRAEKTGTISHLNKHEARYGDFANFDFFEAQLQLARGGEIFDDLPAEIRREFDQNPAKFFDYVNDPANVDRLNQLLPALAAPGRQTLDVNGNISADVAAAREASEQPSTPASPAENAGTPVNPPTGDTTPPDGGSSDPT